MSGLSALAPLAPALESKASDTPLRLPEWQRNTTTTPPRPPTTRPKPAIPPRIAEPSIGVAATTFPVEPAATGTVCALSETHEKCAVQAVTSVGHEHA
jgi:hypothetical protein